MAFIIIVQSAYVARSQRVPKVNLNNRAKICLECRMKMRREKNQVVKASRCGLNIVLALGERVSVACSAQMRLNPREAGIGGGPVHS